MGVDVALMEVSQHGTSPRRRRLRQVTAVIDRQDFFARRFPDSGKPMLSRVDPYKDLILTSSEMAQFIDEIEPLIADSSGEEAERLREVIELARRCQASQNLELHLQGD